MFLFVAGVAGCHTAWTGDIRIEPEVEPQPPRVGRVTITVRVTQSGKPVTGAQIKLEGNMSHAGMAPVFADAREVEAGRYSANMELTMAGDWILSVHVNMPDGTKADQQFDIKGVAPA
ncbi:MAG TPA: FixH family protein [Pyrinomonadaceae bacterium]|nr:FixH family protein [Pyrinomonadaceae bacterium]